MKLTFHYGPGSGATLREVRIPILSFSVSPPLSFQMKNKIRSQWYWRLPPDSDT